MLGHASWTRNDQSPCKRRLIVEADTLDELESDENIEFDNGVIELPIDDCLTHCVHVRRTVELELRRYRPA
jgi:hypothetical protein